MIERIRDFIRHRPVWLRGSMLAVVAVAAATALFWLVGGYFGEGDVALLYLPVVALVAALGDTRSGVVAAVLSFLAGKYWFVPAYFSLAITDPRDWLSLAVFLLIGLAMGMQSQVMRRRRQEAEEREQEAALLYHFSADLVTQESPSSMADLFLRNVITSTGSDRAILFLATANGSIEPFRQIGDGDVAEVLPQARGCYQRADTVSHETPCLIPLRATHGVEGVLYVAARPDGAAYSERDWRTLEALCYLAASFLERIRLQGLAAKAATIEEADRLKNVLISSVSHELKTPLCSVTATLTNLLDDGFALDRNQLRGELAAAAEDLERLNDSIGALLNLSRLESGAWQPNREPCDLGEIVGTTLKRIPRSRRQRITVKLPPQLPPLRVDYIQWVCALQNLLENALSYSASPLPVRVGAEASADEVRLWVEDEGPGVAPEERSRIFEKFYRGSASTTCSTGTGLGLAITHDIVDFHGGRVWAEAGRQQGARFVIAMPLEAIA